MILQKEAHRSFIEKQGEVVTEIPYPFVADGVVAKGKPPYWTLG